jgi:Kef-type K+ transport system membrane component KefB
MNELLAIGITVVVGIIGALLVKRAKQPSVVGWLIVGALLGPSALNLLNPEVLDRLAFVSDITLGLIGFIIGTQITIGALRRLGGGIAALTLFQFLGAFVLVFLGVLIFTRNLPAALLLGALATATAPAGTVAVLEEYRAKGPLTKALLVVVGADDALAIVIFVFAAALAKVLIGAGNLSGLEMVAKPLLEIVIAIAVGVAIGWTFGFFTQSVRANELLLPLSLGAILICIGLSKVWHFSFILATMALGMTMINTFPRVSAKTFGTIESFMPPFYVCFFALAGAHLDVSLLSKVGLIGTIYIVSRIIGKIAGASLGATIGKQPVVTRKYLGFGLISQAGVAVGLAYLIMRQFAPLGEAGQEIACLVMTIIPATTIIFEIIGPMGVRFALTKAGETRHK